MTEKNKRVCIVFEETDTNVPGSFNVYMEGIDTEVLKKIPENEWPRAAFWAAKCFHIVTDAIAAAGAVRSMQPKGRG